MWQFARWKQWRSTVPGRGRSRWDHLHLIHMKSLLTERLETPKKCSTKKELGVLCLCRACWVCACDRLHSSHRDARSDVGQRQFEESYSVPSRPHHRRSRARAATSICQLDVTLVAVGKSHSVQQQTQEPPWRQRQLGSDRIWFDLKKFSGSSTADFGLVKEMLRLINREPLGAKSLPAAHPASSHHHLGHGIHH